jgi:hypothetical protein
MRFDVELPFVLAVFALVFDGGTKALHVPTFVSNEQVVQSFCYIRGLRVVAACAILLPTV